MNDSYIVCRPWFKRNLTSKGVGLIRKVVILFFILHSTFCIHAQSTNLANVNDTAIELLTLKQCIDYALKHQPALQRSLINIDIAKATKAIDLSGWYPQIGGTANITHYIQLPTTISNQNGIATPVKNGYINTAVPGIGITQSIFSPSLQYATKSAPLNIKLAEQTVDSVKIELVASVSKSFYSLLLTLEQINVLKEDTIRLSQNVQDAYHQFIGGIVDETDYEEATITLNNSMVQLKQANENVIPQYANLKQLMGYLPEKQFNISFDSTQMTKEIDFDTTRMLIYDKRIEFQQLATAKNLQHQLTDYYRNAAWPTLSAFYNYNLALENNEFSKLYSPAYPNSNIGLSISVPLFNGFSRVQSEKRAKLQERLIDWSSIDLKSIIYSQYTTALASYKSNLYNLHILQNNVDMSKRVYFVVNLQYKQGIVPYLNVITAESNLIQSEIGYLNALFQLLSSKIDLEKAMGDITY